VGLTAHLTGFLASEYGLRPPPIYLGVLYTILGAAPSIVLVRDTREHDRLETAAHARQVAPISFREIFLLRRSGIAIYLPHIDPGWSTISMTE
jgi:hypothetical protein